MKRIKKDIDSIVKEINIEYDKAILQEANAHARKQYRKRTKTTTNISKSK